MNSIQGTDQQVLLTAVDRAHHAQSLSDVISALVGVLQPRFALCHASIAIVPASGETVRILATWSLADSVFEAGTEISASITEEFRTLVSSLADGHIVSMSITPESGSLLDHVLRQQGVAAVVAIPIVTDEHGLVLLGLGSCSADAFKAVRQSFFAGLGAGIHRRVEALVAE